MEKKQQFEESLETICNFYLKGEKDISKIKEHLPKNINEDIFDELVQEKLIEVSNNEVILTREGEVIAKSITRRHRLAERLLVDILEQKKEDVIHQVACDFEHIISKDVEIAICTLLGHPRECPHGGEIPPGECCERVKKTVESIIVSLDKLSSGEEGKIAYILTSSHPEMHKLMSFGITPGVKIKLHQTFPSYVIQIEEMQLALEKKVAENIYIRRSI